MKNDRCRDVLKRLTDDDIKLIANSVNWESLLYPIKMNTHTYAAEVKQMGGRLDSKSKLGPKKLPKIAVDLYKKGDLSYIEIFGKETETLINQLINILKDTIGKNFSFDDISNYTDDDYKKIFQGVLNTKSINMDMNIFFLQLRMIGGELSEEKKNRIVRIWNREKEIQAIKCQLEREWNKKLEDLKKEIEDQKRIAKVHIKERKKEIQIQIKDLRNQNCILKEKNENLSDDVEKNNYTISNKSDEVKQKEKSINKLKEKIKELNKEKDDIQKRLDDKSEKYYKNLQTKWEKDHEELEDKNLELMMNIEENEEKLSSLKNEEKVLQETVAKWNQQIDQYFENIDEKILNHRIETTLISKMGQASLIVNGPQTTLTNNQLYVQQGYVKNNNEIEKCNNYKDYLEIADSNLDNVCVEKVPNYMGV